MKVIVEIKQTINGIGLTINDDNNTIVRSR